MKVFYSLIEAFEYSKKQEFLLSKNGVLYPMFGDFKNFNQWVVFYPGAYSRDKPMPKFQRATFSNELDANVISLFDPGLLVNKRITNSWFSGGEIWFAEVVARELKSFFDEIGVAYSDVLLFGTSAGGLPSFRAAKDLPGSNVYAGNIQTDARIHPAFNVMFPILFPDYTQEDAKGTLSGRFDARKMDGEFNLFYLQNKCDKPHYNKHYALFREWYISGDRKVNACFLEYDDPTTGHGTIGKTNEILAINQILENKKLNHREFLDLNFEDRLED